MTIRALFDASASRYERAIVPLLLPLTADLIAYAAPRPTDHALDVGTGTGLVARLLAPYVRRVTGIDFSLRSLAVARSIPTPAHVSYAAADITRLPFPPRAFTLILSSFGLNATNPADSLRALRRVCAPGGTLIIQEWGPSGPVDLALDDLLAHYAPDRPDPLDDEPRWTAQLQDTDDYADWLAAYGFAVEDAREDAPVRVRLPSIEPYLTYKLAWTHRHDQLRAMDDSARAAFFAAARQLSLPTWLPVLFRVTARRL